MEAAVSYGMILAFGGQWGWSAWAWLVVPVVVYAVIVIALFAVGGGERSGLENFVFGSISDSLRRATGFPGWSMAGALSGLWSLWVAVSGFYWDVAWHIDYGRDRRLFTVPHVMILVGLGGLVYSAGLASMFATLDRADVGWHIGPLRVPWSAMLLAALGFGAIIAFPLDNLWHEAYGIDVTLWSPTHLQLVGGASLATVAVFLMCTEALPAARPNRLGRGIFLLCAATILVGLSTVQGEFDFGVPQFQVLYQPLLIAAAAAMAMVLGRMALGRWGALKVAVVYLALRGLLALSVGGVLHHSVPRFALYLPSAAAVEVAGRGLGTERRLRFALGAGTLVGTFGVAGELAWVRLSGWASSSMPPELLMKTAVLAPVAAVAAAVIGAGLAGPFSRRDDRLPRAALILAGVSLIGVLIYPLPRRVGHVEALIRLQPLTQLQPVGSVAMVEVDLDPVAAADHAIAFNVTSWQGGGKMAAALNEVVPGRYRSSRPVPISGRWKTTVNLMRGDQLMAAPVYLPSDAAIGAAPVPAVVERHVIFVRNTTLLLREKHPGPLWPALAAYCGVGWVVALWVALLATTSRRVPHRVRSPGSQHTEETGRQPVESSAE